MDDGCYGQVTKIPFETNVRNETFGEAHVIEVEVFGKWDDLVDQIVPGRQMPANYLSSSMPPSMYVKSVQLSRDDGETCLARVQLVQCPDGAKKPYGETWEVSMEAVSHRLLRHPLFAPYGTVQDWIMKWEDTPARLKTYAYKDGEEAKTGFQFEDTDGDSSYDPDGVVRLTRPKMSSDAGRVFAAYCEASLSGIDGYNEYLPVVRHTSQYLRLPGADYDDRTGVCVGGKVSGLESVGTFDEPGLTLAGARFSDGMWFKSRDTFAVNADGTATRSEEWTFFRDKTKLWIYSEDPKAALGA